MTQTSNSMPISETGCGKATFRFVYLLTALVLLILFSPILSVMREDLNPMVAHLLYAVVFTVVMVAAVIAVSGRRSVSIVAVLLGAAALVMTWVQLAVGYQSVQVCHYVASMVFVGYIIALILRYLFIAPRVTLDVVFASLCAYLLLGVAWGLAYSIVDITSPGSFIYLGSVAEAVDGMQITSGRDSVAVYFSLVTMTTLGYGDITPASPVTRMLAAVQALTGQLYLAVLVARLVAMHIIHSAQDVKRDPSSD